MPFVKLDCGMLDSTIWIDREAREVFITALLMAEPYATPTPLPTMAVRTADKQPFLVPAGAYGFVPAAGVGIVRRCGLDQEVGLKALERLGEPEADSRNPDHQGRRLVRVNGGYIVLNYFKYRDYDYTTAARSKRYRERLKGKTSRRDSVTSRRDITHADADADADKNKKAQAPGASPPPVEGLDEEVWRRWEGYRAEIKKPLRKPSQNAARKALAKFGADQAAVVEQSIANGWQGLFALKSANGQSPATNEAQKAWERLLSTGGADRAGATDKALTAIGGWQRIRMRTAFDEAKIRAEFCHAYGE